MDKRMVNGTVYMLVPEMDDCQSCRGCAGVGDDDLCIVLSEECSNGIFVEAPKEEPVKETQSRYQIAKEVNLEYINCKEPYAQNTFEYYCLYMQKQHDPEYKEYLRLKEKFKE